MKYIIDVPDMAYNQDYSYDEILHTLKLKFYDDNLSCEVLLDAESYTEPDRKAIEDEVWELADYMCKMSPTERTLCFAFEYPSEVTTNLTYQEAKSKFEKWVEKDGTFDTGDEVYDKEIDSKGVILRRYNSDTLDILWDDGSAGETIGIKAITKTGRHFDEVEELLKEMRGEKE